MWTLFYFVLCSKHLLWQKMLETQVVLHVDVIYFAVNELSNLDVSKLKLLLLLLLLLLLILCDEK